MTVKNNFEFDRLASAILHLLMRVLARAFDGGEKLRAHSGTTLRVMYL